MAIIEINLAKAEKEAVFAGFAGTHNFSSFRKKARKTGHLRPEVRFWSSLRESNPYNQLGKLVFYH